MTEALDCWAEIDLGALELNAKRLGQLLSSSTKMMAVVKANGYGHGDVQVARAAIDGGAEWLGVARTSEGVRLRADGIDEPILLLAEPPFAAISQAIEAELTFGIYTREGAERLSDEAVRLGKTAAAHVKIDTGMRRYGIQPQEARSFVDSVRKLSGLQVTGLWTHLARSEDQSSSFTKQQLETFEEVLSKLDAEGLTIHVCNSAGAILHPEAHFDMVRFGIALYGIPPVVEIGERISLDPVMAVKSRVGMVKSLPADTPLSYGGIYSTTHETTVVTVPIGYADGLRRNLSNQGEVLIGGTRHRISGNVTMDHLLVDVGDTQITRGDEVVILGRQGGEQITASEIASLLGTIPYEVVCGFGGRMPRVYLGGSGGSV